MLPLFYAAVAAVFYLPYISYIIHSPEALSDFLRQTSVVVQSALLGTRAPFATITDSDSFCTLPEPPFDFRVDDNYVFANDTVQRIAPQASYPTLLREVASSFQTRTSSGLYDLYQEFLVLWSLLSPREQVIVDIAVVAALVLLYIFMGLLRVRRSRKLPKQEAVRRTPSRAAASAPAIFRTELSETTTGNVFVLELRALDSVLSQIGLTDSCGSTLRRRASSYSSCGSEVSEKCVEYQQGSVMQATEDCVPEAIAEPAPEAIEDTATEAIAEPAPEMSAKCIEHQQGSIMKATEDGALEAIAEPAPEAIEDTATEEIKDSVSNKTQTVQAQTANEIKDELSTNEEYEWQQFIAAVAEFQPNLSTAAVEASRRPSVSPTLVTNDVWVNSAGINPSNPQSPRMVNSGLAGLDLQRASPLFFLDLPMDSNSSSTPRVAAVAKRPAHIRTSSDIPSPATICSPLSRDPLRSGISSIQFRFGRAYDAAAQFNFERRLRFGADSDDGGLDAGISTRTIDALNIENGNAAHYESRLSSGRTVRFSLPAVTQANELEPEARRRPAFAARRARSATVSVQQAIEPEPVPEPRTPTSIPLLSTNGANADMTPGLSSNCANLRDSDPFIARPVSESQLVDTVEVQMEAEQEDAMAIPSKHAIDQPSEDERVQSGRSRSNTVCPIRRSRWGPADELPEVTFSEEQPLAKDIQPLSQSYSRHVRSHSSPDSQAPSPTMPPLEYPPPGYVIPARRRLASSGSGDVELNPSFEECGPGPVCMIARHPHGPGAGQNWRGGFDARNARLTSAESEETNCEESVERRPFAAVRRRASWAGRCGRNVNSRGRGRLETGSMMVDRSDGVKA